MDTTPLLAAAGGLPGPNTMQDHPAFLRASHSPWRFIPQNILVILRGLVLAYLVALGVMGSDYKLGLESDYPVWRFLFDFSVISYVFVSLYHIITFSWTFTHLYYPNPEDNEGGIEGFFVKLMSLPRNMASLRKQFYFTMFYTLTTVFAFMNSTIYWFITRAHSLGDDSSDTPDDGDAPEAVLKSGGNIGAPFSDLFGEGWFKPFVVFNFYAVTSAIMVIEILFLNSIKRPFAIGSHLFGLVVSAGLYLAWATLGKYLTGWDAFFWLNKKEVGGKEAVTAYCMGFVFLAPLMYILMQGFVAVREGITSLTEGRGPAASTEGRGPAASTEPLEE
ncbi:hypothetical protein LIA77_10878 [Sarocladium implicatum]|nr:hypothetical protein LIA77_10878 [Sarocladium implicatum]